MAEQIERHAEDCSPGYSCVECGGCECGLVASVCDGPGCYSVDAHEQDYDESGDDKGCPYGCH